MNNCDCPIRRLDILPFIKGGTIISWVLESGYQFASEPTITIEVSRHATEDDAAWTLLDTVPVSDLSIVDPTQRTFGASEQVYYRATITPPGCTSDAYPSLMGNIPCQLRPILREIVRRERLRHAKGEAQPGVLLKRKYSGTPCTECRDPDFPDQQTKSGCETCYDTGWVGGYFQNRDFYTDLNKTSFGNNRGDYRQVADNNFESAIQYLNIPDVQPGDVWVELQSDHRWLISSVETLTRVGSYVVLAAAKVAKLPFNDIVYQLDVPKN